MDINDTNSLKNINDLKKTTIDNIIKIVNKLNGLWRIHETLYKTKLSARYTVDSVTDPTIEKEICIAITEEILAEITYKLIPELIQKSISVFEYDQEKYDFDYSSLIDIINSFLTKDDIIIISPTVLTMLRAKNDVQTNKSTDKGILQYTGILNNSYNTNVYVDQYMSDRSPIIILSENSFITHIQSFENIISVSDEIIVDPNTFEPMLWFYSSIGFEALNVRTIRITTYGLIGFI